jgi:hypothetical protein
MGRTDGGIPKQAAGRQRKRLPHPPMGGLPTRLGSAGTGLAHHPSWSHRCQVQMAMDCAYLEDKKRRKS